MEEEQKQIVEMTDEEGNVVKLEHLMTFEFGDQFYSAFLPVMEAAVDGEEDTESDEVVLMRLESDESNEDIFYPIDDEEELERVWENFLEVYYSDEETPDE